MLAALFGAKAQAVVGIIFLAATLAQTFYWTVVTQPTVSAVFLVSMEALLFASFNQLGSALGYRATERVETAVIENIEQADEVTIGKES